MQFYMFLKISTNLIFRFRFLMTNESWIVMYFSRIVQDVRYDFTTSQSRHYYRSYDLSYLRHYFEFTVTISFPIIKSHFTFPILINRILSWWDYIWEILFDKKTNVCHHTCFYMVCLSPIPHNPLPHPPMQV